jgi:plasmid maintenance system antidote protein VapI
MKRTDPPAPISDLLRRTIAESGLPYLTLERATGIARASIMRFVRGSQFLRLDLADRLAAYFGLELQPKRRGK